MDLPGRGKWWDVVSTSGTAEELHSRPIPPHCERLVWSHRVERPALVLGSTQPDKHITLDASSKAEVLRRRSGGGAVLVQTYDTWIDVLIGSDDQLWDDDVGKAFGWIGDVWARAFRSLDVNAAVHTGGLENREAGKIVCFAGLGPGEVSDSNGIKLLGLSQRRTRNVARFQCLVPYRSPISHTTDLLDPQWIPEGVDGDTLIGAVLDPSVLTTAFLTELARLP